MINLINKKLKNFYTNNIGIVYILFLILVSILSLIFTHQLILKIPYLINSDNEIIISNIPFGYGPLIDNFFNGNGYVREWNGVATYLSRLPFIPLFNFLLFKLSLNIYFVLITKNIIFFTLYFYFCHNFCKKENKNFVYFFFLISIIFYNYYNLITNLNFFFADAYIGVVLPTIFILLNSDHNFKNFIIGILLFFLYLMKTTMLFPTFAIAILYIFFEKKTHILIKLIPLVFLILSMISWGIFGYIKTGVFAVGSKISSDNQQALNIVMNNEFHKYYPKKTVDIIPKKKSLPIFKNEWESYEYYKELNTQFIKNNKPRVLKDIIIKLKFIFFNIRKDSVENFQNDEKPNPIMFSHILNRIFFLVSIIVSVILILKNIRNIRYCKNEIYFLGIVTSSIFPHLIGWATSKHLVGIFIVSHLYLFFKIKKYL